jgi:hypothetical protein
MDDEKFVLNVKEEEEMILPRSRLKIRSTFIQQALVGGWWLAAG